MNNDCFLKLESSALQIAEISRCINICSVNCGDNLRLEETVIFIVYLNSSTLTSLNEPELGPAVGS